MIILGYTGICISYANGMSNTKSNAIYKNDDDLQTKCVAIQTLKSVQISFFMKTIKKVQHEQQLTKCKVRHIILSRFILKIEYFSNCNYI